MWRFVFNTQFLWTNLMRHVEKTVRDSGYSMFTWQGEVYRVPAVGEDFLSQPLRLKVEDLT